MDEEVHDLQGPENDRTRTAANIWSTATAPLRAGVEGGSLHDPCTIAYLLKPSLFQGKRVNVEVETESEFTIGETVVDFWGVTAREPNVEWIYTAEADGFYDLLTERLSEFG